MFLYRFLRRSVRRRHRWPATEFCSCGFVSLLSGLMALACWLSYFRRDFDLEFPRSNMEFAISQAKWSDYIYISLPGDLWPFFVTCIKKTFSTKRIISDVYADMNIICFYLYWEVGRIPPLFSISKNSDCFKNSSSEVHNRSCCSCMVGISCVDLYKYVLTISYMKYRFLCYHLRSHENNRSQWQETLFTRCRLSLPENIFTSPEMADGKPALDSISKGLWDHYISVRKRCVPFMEIRFIIVLLWLV